MVFFLFVQRARFSVQFYLNRKTHRVLEHDFLALSLFEWPADVVFLDIGANRGFSIQAMRSLVPHTKIEAFEPNVVLFQKSQRLYRGDIHVSLHPIGLGDENTDTILWVPGYR